MGHARQQQISIVVAAADNGVIGHRGDLPWHLPADLKHFKSITMGKPIVMGRKTFESIGRPLPGRDNIVITRNPDYDVPPGVHLAGGLDDALALALASGAAEVMIIGGADIYDQALDKAERIYLTEVHASPIGDTYFPEIDADAWKEKAREDFPANRDAPAFSFVVLERAPSGR